MSEHHPLLPRPYKLFAVVFFIVAALGLTAVSFATWSRAEIVLIPSRQAIDFEFTVSVGSQQDVSAGVIAGGIVQATADTVQEFKASGTKTITYTAGSKTPVGSVTLHNTGTASQSLIATTRLAHQSAPDVVVARLAQTVTIPAGGTVVVNVYTDQPQQFKQVAAGKLIIPGLRQNLWEKVYAEVVSPLVVRESTTVVSAEDIAKATATMKDATAGIFSKKIDELVQPDRRAWPKLIATTMNNATFDATVDAEVAQFIGSATVEGVGVVFDPSQLVAVAQQKLRDVAGVDTGHMTLRIEDFTYRLDSHDVAANTALISVHIATQAATLSDPALFDASAIAGKTHDEVRDYYKKYSDIADIEITMSPNWRTQLPGNQSRIKIRTSGK